MENSLEIWLLLLFFQKNLVLLSICQPPAAAGAAMFPGALPAGTTTFNFVDGSGNVVADGSPAANFVEYCELPGLRIRRSDKIEINGNILDTILREQNLMYYKQTPIDQRTTLAQLLGQEPETEAIGSTFGCVNNVLNYDNNVFTPYGAYTNSATAVKRAAFKSGAQLQKQLNQNLF